jgi:hypothetical protein
MYDNEKKDLMHKISIEVLKVRGYDQENSLYKNEFNLNDINSQISMVYEDVEAAVNYLERNGYMLYPEIETIDTCNDPIVDIYKPPSGFSCTTRIHVRLSSGSNLKDLKHFVSRLEEMKIPEDADIDGHLSLDLNFDDAIIERTTCGDCGYEDYLIVPNDH